MGLCHYPSLPPSSSSGICFLCEAGLSLSGQQKQLSLQATATCWVFIHRGGCCSFPSVSPPPPGEPGILCTFCPLPNVTGLRNQRGQGPHSSWRGN